MDELCQKGGLFRIGRWIVHNGETNISRFVQILNGTVERATRSRLREIENKPYGDASYFSEFVWQSIYLSFDRLTWEILRKQTPPWRCKYVIFSDRRVDRFSFGKEAHVSSKNGKMFDFDSSLSLKPLRSQSQMHTSLFFLFFLLCWLLFSFFLFFLFELCVFEMKYILFLFFLFLFLLCI